MSYIGEEDQGSILGVLSFMSGSSGGHRLPAQDSRVVRGHDCPGLHSSFTSLSVMSLSMFLLNCVCSLFICAFLSLRRSFLIFGCFIYLFMSFCLSFFLFVYYLSFC